MTAWPTAIGIVVIVVWAVEIGASLRSRETFEELVYIIWVFEFLTVFFDRFWRVFPTWHSEHGRCQNGDRWRLEAK
jgi:hypothetical protein